jgi:hypothetical protein
MGLTKRKDSYYVEFPVLDDGKHLSLARGVPGAELKRWRVGGTRNKQQAQDCEATIKHRLLNGTMSSDRASTTLTRWASGPRRTRPLRRSHGSAPTRNGASALLRSLCRLWQSHAAARHHGG